MNAGTGPSLAALEGEGLAASGLIVDVNDAPGAVGCWFSAQVREPSHEIFYPPDEDAGPGIADEILPQLFQAFVSSKAESMRLSLSICRTIIEAHGGHIWAGALPSGGTAFRFTLFHARTEEEHEG